MKSAASFRLRNRKAFLLAATLLGACLHGAPVLPTGGSVVAGAGSLSQSGSTLTVTQTTAKMAVNWDSFSIGADAAVRFVQPSAASVALNRVTGADVSVIQGSLSANGQVFLLNPNGVLFSKTAQVNVGGLVASTLALSNEDFHSGNLTFAGPGAGVVVNEGNLVAVAGGSVSLLSARVVNTGEITAERGSVNLAAGSRVTLNLGGLVNVNVEQGAVDALVRNGGAIRADGGQVLLTARGAGELAAAAISNEGLIEARTLATGEKGEILLLGGLSGGDTVSVSGSLDVSAPAGGDGGFIETSAAFVNIADSASINALAVAGRRGSWLLDPDFIEVVATGGVSVGTANGTVGGTSQISVTALSAALNQTDVSLQALQQIDFKVAFSHAGDQDATLTLLAPTIKLGGDITASAKKLGLAFGDGVTYAGNIFLYNPAGVASVTRTLTTNGGDVVFHGNIGGAHDFVVDAGAGATRFSATVDGNFQVWQLVTGTMAFSYQAGGGQGSVTTIDFSVPKVSFFDGAVTTDANQYNPVSKNGTTYPIVFPKGYLVIPAGAQIDFNAQQVPVTITRPDGTIDPVAPVGSANGTVTFANDTNISKISFSQTNGSWTDIFATDVTWMSDTAAGKPLNLTVKAGTTIIDPSRTISVDGDVRISTAKFINSSTDQALVPGTGRTWQVWSTNQDPFSPTSGDINGGLHFDFKQYGAVYGDPVAGTGNGLFYAITPQLALSLVGTVTKVYDKQYDANNLTNANYAVDTGVVDGDIIGFAGSLPVHGLHLTYGVGTGISITSDVISSASITATSSAATGSKPVYGYGLANNTATGNIGIITKATITGVTGVTANDKVYDGLLGAGLNLNPGSQGFTGMVPGDDLVLTSATGAFGTASAGPNKVVTVGGLVFGGNSLANYELPASFTVNAEITKAPLSVIARDFTKPYGQAYAGGNGVDYVGLVNGEQPGVLTGVLDYTGDSQGAFVPGSYVIRPTGLNAANYQLTFVDGILTIEQPPVDPRDFLPRANVVPVYPVAPLVVQIPMTVGGLNYVPVTTPAAVVTPAAVQAQPAPAPASVAAVDAPQGKDEGKIGEAVDRIDRGASRSIQGPTDVIVINGGINLGAKPLSAQ